MKRTIFAAILDALLSVWTLTDQLYGRIVGRLTREIFGAIDRDFVQAAAAHARAEMWS